MKIAVISDSHLGYGYGSEIEEDSFKQFEEALDKAIALKADLILLAGDIFDERDPKQEVLARALHIFQKPLVAEKNHTTVTDTIDKGKKFSPITFSGIPVVAIHGTHERRGERYVNPIETMEKAAFLIHLHKNGVIFDINGEKLCVQGLSGVPERDVKHELLEWAPKPQKECINILMFHQSLHEYIYDKDNTFIGIEDLPKGFDIYIDGHIHWNSLVKKEGKVFLFPGSTVITQQKKIEAEQKKGFYFVEFVENIADCKFIELENQRQFYLQELKFKDASISDVIQKSKEAVERFLKKEHKIKPLIRLKLTGSLEKGKQKSTISETEIAQHFANKAIVTIDKGLESESFKEKIEQLRKAQKGRRSVDDMGMEIIEKLLKETNYKGLPLNKILDALADGDSDEIIKKVMDEFEKI